MRGAVMVCGTASDVGKSHVVSGLCRLLARRGVRVAPFKAQNMSLNSAVTAGGHEIGRAQAAQAFAARVEPEVAMNPILLKPTGPTGCQVVVRGVPVGHLEADEYHRRKPELMGVVRHDLADLRARYDVVILEGAGSPAEINLADRDLVNLALAVAAGIDAVVVGSIDRGGVFAALAGTVALLGDEQRRRVRGFVINKFRGDPALLFDGTDRLEAMCGVPTLGVLPWMDDVALDAEDSLAFEGVAPRPIAGGGVEAGGPAAVLDVAAVRLPHTSNATDLDPLALEPGVRLRWVDHGAMLGDPDLVVVPGSKATVSDLAWLRRVGLDRAIAATDATVLGICAGAQLLGTSISDPHGVEAPAGTSVAGLGLLGVATVFGVDKVTRRRSGAALGAPVEGYEIHHGRTVPSARPGAGSVPWLVLDGGEEGAVNVDGSVWGTSLHGLFEADGFRERFLVRVAERRGRAWAPSGVSFPGARDAQADRLADALEAHLDLDALERIIAGAVGP